MRPGACDLCVTVQGWGGKAESDDGMCRGCRRLCACVRQSGTNHWVGLSAPVYLVAGEGTFLCVGQLFDLWAGVLPSLGGSRLVRLGAPRPSAEDAQEGSLELDSFSCHLLTDVLPSFLSVWKPLGAKGGAHTSSALRLGGVQQLAPCFQTYRQLS